MSHSVGLDVVLPSPHFVHLVSLLMSVLSPPCADGSSCPSLLPTGSGCSAHAWAPWEPHEGRAGPGPPQCQCWPRGLGWPAGLPSSGNGQGFDVCPPCLVVLVRRCIWRPSPDLAHQCCAPIHRVCSWDSVWTRWCASVALEGSSGVLSILPRDEVSGFWSRAQCHRAVLHTQWCCPWWLCTVTTGQDHNPHPDVRAWQGSSLPPVWPWGARFFAHGGWWQDGPWVTGCIWWVKVARASPPQPLRRLRAGKGPAVEARGSDSDFDSSNAMWFWEELSTFSELNSFYLSLFFPKGKDGAYISGVAAQGDEGRGGTQQRLAPSLLGCWLSTVSVCVCVCVWAPFLQLKFLICREPEHPPSRSQIPSPLSLCLLNWELPPHSNCPSIFLWKFISNVSLTALSCALLSFLLHKFNKRDFVFTPTWKQANTDRKPDKRTKKGTLSK